MGCDNLSGPDGWGDSQRDTQGGFFLPFSPPKKGRRLSQKTSVKMGYFSPSKNVRSKTRC